MQKIFFNLPLLERYQTRIIMKQQMFFAIIATILLCLSSCGSSHKRIPVPTDPNAKVWVCTGESSERYHAHNDCKGLRNCRASVEEISLQEAESIGRTPCKKCYKK